MLIKYRKPILALIDGIIILSSYYLALLLRFEGQISHGQGLKFLQNLFAISWLYVLVGVSILFIVGFYRNLSAKAGILELAAILVGITIASAINYIIPILFLTYEGHFLPRSVTVITLMIQILLISGTRLMWRIMTDKNLKLCVKDAVHKTINFSPPDITDVEISEVVKAMKSGWITTGPRTKEFERRIAEFTGCKKAACLSSATAAMELTLRIMGIGPGDEVITTPYTYTATASVIFHVGAKIVLVDTYPDSFEMDYTLLAQAINENTKAVIPVDIAGKMCDYEKIYNAVESKKHLFKPNSELQKTLGRCIVLTDGAHAFGAQRKGKKCGQAADFTCFSFHAVKNLTTAEGGAVVWRNDIGLDNDDIYKKFMLYSLHGQSKDALTKSQKGSWEYDVIYPAYKFNMTDILAGFGLMQLGRFESLLERRRQIIEKYDNELKGMGLKILKHFGDDFSSTGHLYLVRIPGIDEEVRNDIITGMSEMGVCTNVHYKPLPMLTAYNNLGLNIEDYPNAYDLYKNEITLPLHTLLSDEDVVYVCDSFKFVVCDVLGLDECKIVEHREQEVGCV